MLWMMMAMTASADTFTLDSGAVIEGRMVVYNYGGECQMSVTSGDLVGSIVLIPCDRIVSFSKAPAVPAPPMEAPALSAAAIEEALAVPAEAPPAEAPPAEAPPAEAPPVILEEVAVEAVPVEAPLPVEEVAPAPEIVEVAAAPVEAPFADEAIEEPEEAPIAPEPEPMAATPWADESGAPADGVIRSDALPERSIGGVAIPALPNLRIIRTAEPEVAPEVGGE